MRYNRVSVAGPVISEALGAGTDSSNDTNSNAFVEGQQKTVVLGPVDKLDSQARQNLIQDSFCGVYLGAFADGGCRVGVL